MSCALPRADVAAVKRYGALDAQIETYVRDMAMAGAVVLVAQDGRIEHQAAFGFQDITAATPMRQDTLFRIFSMTKPVTATAIMLLVDDGVIALDDPVEKYLPEFRGNTVYAATGPVAARPMTVGQLLTHTSGLSYSFQPRSPVAAQYTAAGLAGGSWYHNAAIKGLDDFARRIAPIPLVFQPGEAWHYSMGTDVAAVVVQRASGMPFEIFLKTRLFDPLSMSDTDFQVAPGQAGRLATLYAKGPSGLASLETGNASVFLNPPSAPSGGGGLISTASDYFRFAQMLLDGGTYDGRRVLSSASAQAIMTNHLPAAMGSSPLGEAAAFGYGATAEGLGFGYGGAVVVDAKANGGYGSVGEYGWAGAANTLFWIDPVQNRVVVFMTQLLPSGSIPLRDTLRQLVYADPTTAAATP